MILLVSSSQELVARLLMHRKAVPEAGTPPTKPSFYIIVLAQGVLPTRETLVILIIRT